MIDRISLFKLVSGESDPERRDGIAKRATRIAAERGLSLEVGVPADAASAKSWDVAIVVRGPDVASVDAIDVEGLLAEAAGSPSAIEFRKGWSFERV